MRNTCIVVFSGCVFVDLACAAHLDKITMQPCDRRLTWRKLPIDLNFSRRYHFKLNLPSRSNARINCARFLYAITDCSLRVFFDNEVLIFVFVGSVRQVPVQCLQKLQQILQRR